MQAVTITQITPPEFETLIENSVRKVLSESPKQNNSEPADQFLTIKQASEFLTLSVPTIYSKVHCAAIPVNKKGKRLYFSKQELTDWIKAGRKKTALEIAAAAENYLNKTKKKK